MRKKSHILLARCIADQMKTAGELHDHRKAFCLGNILPDIKPSFFTEKHEFEETFGSIEEKMEDLTADWTEDWNERVYWRRLGEIIHYVADYFTFPHNGTFEGNLRAHGQYERVLSQNLKSYIKDGHAGVYMETAVLFPKLQDLIAFIQTQHQTYLCKKRCIQEDIEFILTTCYQAAQGLFALLNGARPVPAY